jgi:hypothetical protein
MIFRKENNYIKIIHVVGKTKCRSPSLNNKKKTQDVMKLFVCILETLSKLNTTIKPK